MIPQGLSIDLHEGIAKSAMNAFAAICHAALVQNPDCQIVTGDDPYFEEGDFPDICPLKEAIKNPRKVGLYVGTVLP